MQDPQAVAERFVAIFERIHQEQMLGLPLLNNKLQVETLGFQDYQGRIVGILITPWLMNIVMLPGENDTWAKLNLGYKQAHQFPGGAYKFMVNEVEGIGTYQTHSLYSPMREFHHQKHAIAAAKVALRKLMTPVAADGETPIDEELLGRVMRGEATPEIDAEALDALESDAFGPKAAMADRSSDKHSKETELSRRKLLRGLLGDT